MLGTNAQNVPFCHQFCTNGFFMLDTCEAQLTHTYALSELWLAQNLVSSMHKIKLHLSESDFTSSIQGHDTDKMLNTCYKEYMCCRAKNVEMYLNVVLKSQNLDSICAFKNQLFTMYCNAFMLTTVLVQAIGHRQPIMWWLS